jgi:hypothetical protein
MSKKQLFSVTLASLMIVGQFGWTAAAAAEDSTPTPTPAVAESPTSSPNASPEPSVSASASPDLSPSVEPSASASPSSPTVSAAAASVSPSTTTSASPEVTPAQSKQKSTDVGPDGCGGVIPNWVFDTASSTWIAADKGSFTCDKTSGYYLSPKYYFDKRIGWYEIIPASQTASLPDYMISAPNLVHTVLGDLIVGSKDYQVAKALGLLDSGSGGILAPAGSNLAGTGAGSSNQIASGTGGQSWFDLTNLVNVINVLQSNATSGNVAVNSNTAAGNAATGAASVLANLINLLASAWSWSNGNLSFFMQNIFAPLTGDITLNPTQTVSGGGGKLGATINGTGANSNNTVDVNNPNSLNVDAQNTGNIVNNVDVNAISGNAAANKNTVVGDVATGNAMAQVNIINLINSFINSGSSFFGILNIIGSLNGDILFPAGFLDGLLPAGTAGGTTANIAGTGAGSNNQVGLNNSSASNITNTVSNSVNNNISTNAVSGAANLDANTSAGNVSTGAASTNQGLFNIANSSIFGDNAVLVMVNVLGHWVGKIMTLPGTGTSQSALLTGNATVGINNTGAGSNNTVNADNSSKSDINQSSTGTITNNVNVNAQSGNADVSKNTSVGNVSTGKAQANSSVANIFNTVLNVKHWFGVLVINVFGDWIGDVNHDSAAGGYSTAAGAVGGDGGATGTVAGTNGALPPVGLLALVSPVSRDFSNASVTSTSSGVTPVSGSVLTASAQSTPKDVAAAAQAKNMSFLFVISALVMLVAGALATIDKQLKRR